MATTIRSKPETPNNSPQSNFVPTPGIHSARFSLAKRIIPYLCGVVLLGASLLKFEELISQPLVEQGFLSSRPALIFAVEVELAIGLLLISSLFARVSRTMGIALFLFLAAVATWKIIAGEPCHCLGRAGGDFIKPMHMLIFDFSAALGLFWSLPRSPLCTLSPSPFVGEGRQSLSPSPLVGEGRGEGSLLWPWHRLPADALVEEGQTENRFRLLAPAALILIFLLLGVPAGIVMGNYRPAQLNGDGDILGVGDVVLLEPEKWVGKKLPLLPFIEINDDLGRGDWLIVLYHHDCPKCQALFPRLESLAAEFSLPSGGGGQSISLPPGGGGLGWGGNGQRTGVRPLPARANPPIHIALIAVPPYADDAWSPVPSDSPCRLGKLKDVKNWFVSAPAVLFARGGVVETVPENLKIEF